MIDLIWLIVFNATFSNISAISWRPVLVVEEATRWEPHTMGKQLVTFITCGCELSAPFFVIYKAGYEPKTKYGWSNLTNTSIIGICIWISCGKNYIFFTTFIPEISKLQHCTVWSNDSSCIKVNIKILLESRILINQPKIIL